MADQSAQQPGSMLTLSDSEVAEIVRRVLTVVRPARLILFGSAATGTMTPDSDVDLLVVLDEVNEPHAQAVSVRNALAGLPFSFDVIVMTRERFEETRGVIGGVAWPAARHGKVIYETA